MRPGNLSKLGGASNIQIQKTGPEGSFLAAALLPASDLERWAVKRVREQPAPE